MMLKQNVRFVARGLFARVAVAWYRWRRARPGPATAYAWLLTVVYPALHWPRPDEPLLLPESRNTPERLNWHHMQHAFPEAARLADAGAWRGLREWMREQRPAWEVRARAWERWLHLRQRFGRVFGDEQPSRLETP